MRVALGQFIVDREWQKNLQTCIDLMLQAESGGAKLLVLPEGVLARDINDPTITQRTAQPLEGEFLTQLLAANKELNITVVTCFHIPISVDKTANVQVVIHRGKLIAQYHKIHLYDAFAVKESMHVLPGDKVPALIEVCGLKVGLMTCYDVRFPELARHLVLDGAQILVVPSAWVKGPLKEEHWDILVKARALENTVYVLAVSECGEANIGKSMVVDPLGVVIARAAEVPALIFAEIDPKRLSYAREILPVLENCRFRKPELK